MCTCVSRLTTERGWNNNSNNNNKGDGMRAARSGQSRSCGWSGNVRKIHCVFVHEYDVAEQNIQRFPPHPPIIDGQSNGWYMQSFVGYLGDSRSMSWIWAIKMSKCILVISIGSDMRRPDISLLNIATISVAPVLPLRRYASEICTSNIASKW